MQQTMTVDVYAAQIARMDSGQVYASLLVGQKVIDEKAENAKGLQIMKLSCNEDVYHSIDLRSVPSTCDLQVILKRGAGGKMGNHCVASKPVRLQRDVVPKV
jgi:hypothetical protein